MPVQPYTTAVGIVELPYLLAQAIVFMPIAYFLIGARHTPSSCPISASRRVLG